MPAVFIYVFFVIAFICTLCCLAIFITSVVVTTLSHIVKAKKRKIRALWTALISLLATIASFLFIMILTTIFADSLYAQKISDFTDIVVEFNDELSRADTPDNSVTTDKIN